MGIHHRIKTGNQACMGWEGQGEKGQHRLHQLQVQISRRVYRALMLVVVSFISIPSNTDGITIGLCIASCIVIGQCSWAHTKANPIGAPVEVNVGVNGRLSHINAWCLKMFISFRHPSFPCPCPRSPIDRVP